MQVKVLLIKSPEEMETKINKALDELAKFYINDIKLTELSDGLMAMIMYSKRGEPKQ